MGLEGDHFGNIYDLQALDCGFKGMGALSGHHVPTGSLFTLSFEHSGYRPVHGRVVTCTAGDDGYRLGFRFERPLAA